MTYSDTLLQLFGTSEQLVTALQGHTLLADEILHNNPIKQWAKVHTKIFDQY